MSTEQLFLQLGICGAMLFVWWRIETKRIDRNAQTEDKKTEAMAEGFKSLSGKVDSHHTADITSHGELSADVAEIKGMLRERSGAHVAPIIPRPKQSRVDTPATGVATFDQPKTKPQGGR